MYTQLSNNYNPGESLENQHLQTCDKLSILVNNAETAEDIISCFMRIADIDITLLQYYFTFNYTWLHTIILKARDLRMYREIKEFLPKLLEPLEVYPTGDFVTFIFNNLKNHLADLFKDNDLFTEMILTPNKTSYQDFNKSNYLLSFIFQKELFEVVKTSLNVKYLESLFGENWPYTLINLLVSTSLPYFENMQKRNRLNLDLKNWEIYIKDHFIDNRQFFQKLIWTLDHYGILYSQKFWEPNNLMTINVEFLSLLSEFIFQRSKINRYVYSSTIVTMNSEANKEDSELTQLISMKLETIAAIDLLISDIFQIILENNNRELFLVNLFKGLYETHSISREIFSEISPESMSALFILIQDLPDWVVMFEDLAVKDTQRKSKSIVIEDIFFHFQSIFEFEYYILALETFMKSPKLLKLIKSIAFNIINNKLFQIASIHRFELGEISKFIRYIKTNDIDNSELIEWNDISQTILLLTGGHAESLDVYPIKYLKALHKFMVEFQKELSLSDEFGQKLLADIENLIKLKENQKSK